jgi:hypothetical protein
MKIFIAFAVAGFSFLSFTCPPSDQQNGWISLFDGTLNNWKVGKNAATFSIEDGCIKVNGPVAHLYYDGPVKKHIFRNFEFRAEVKTLPGSNSGIYFHTSYQEAGWPDRGYEVQVNNSHTDWRRTGSLYDIVDISETYAKDNEWYTEYIKVEGKHVIIKVNDKVVVDYTEPCDVKREDNHPLRLITGGTFALQGHDPKSIVYYRNIMVKPLPD